MPWALCGGVGGGASGGVPGPHGGGGKQHPGVSGPYRDGTGGLSGLHVRDWGVLPPLGGVGGPCAPWGGFWGVFWGCWHPTAPPFTPLPPSSPPPQSLEAVAQLGDTAAEVMRLAGGGRHQAMGEWGGYPKTHPGGLWGGLLGYRRGVGGGSRVLRRYFWNWGGESGVGGGTSGTWGSLSGGGVPFFGVPPLIAPPPLLPTETRVAALQQHFQGVPKTGGPPKD